jgi:uncharacterized protein (TIGR03435 family)
MQKFIAVVAILFTMAIIPATAQTANSQEAAVFKPLTWDVVSIKPHKQLDNSSSMQSTLDGIEFRNSTLHALFLNAFEVRSESQITGYPAWVSSEHFDIRAKMDADTAAAYRNLKGDDGGRQWRAFMRQILDERFGMKFHIEKRELPVYNLVVAKQGLKLKESAHDDTGSSSMGRGKLTAHRSEVGSLAFSLSGAVGRVILDKTGLTALYDIDLNWSPDNEPDTGPSIFTALQEQLGLKLEPANAPLDVVVIDHIERPSEN